MSAPAIASCAPLWIAEDQVRLGDGAEMLDGGRRGVHVGMEGAGELAVDRLDLLAARAWRDAEHLVRVGPSHRGKDRQRGPQPPLRPAPPDFRAARTPSCPTWTAPPSAPRPRQV